LYLCVLIVFSLHRESLKLILAMNPFLRWFCRSGNPVSNSNFRENLLECLINEV
jgi:hypothetical protein